MDNLQKQVLRSKLTHQAPDDLHGQIMTRLEREMSTSCKRVSWWDQQLILLPLIMTVLAVILVSWGMPVIDMNAVQWPNMTILVPSLKHTFLILAIVGVFMMIIMLDRLHQKMIRRYYGSFLVS